MLLSFPRAIALRRLAAATGIGLALGGCSLFSGEYSDVKCPATGVVSGVGTLSRFDGRGTGFVDLGYRASLGAVKSDCAVDSTGVTVTLMVSTLAELGPAATGRTADFPYFVAVTDSKDKIIAKRVFANSLTFKPDQNRTGGRDTVSERIPLEDPKQAPRYHVILGFQLTEEELAYNRSLH